MRNEHAEHPTDPLLAPLARSLAPGSDFFFTMVVKIDQISPDLVMEKLRPFNGRNIFWLDTLRDTTGVEQMLLSLGLRPITVHSVEEAAERTKGIMPRIDAIIADTLSVVEDLRTIEHLRYIPINLVSPTMLTLNLTYCLDHGISSYINTPATMADLHYALLPSLESSAATPSEANNSEVYDILLCEDNRVNVVIAMRMLEREGHKVSTVSDGKQAVDAVTTGKFDVVLMDVSMPVMSGIEATKCIRTFEESQGVARTPIIALTAHAMKGDKERCLASGMDEYCSKPLRKLDLLTAIRQVTMHKRSGGGSAMGSAMVALSARQQQAAAAAAAAAAVARAQGGGPTGPLPPSSSGSGFSYTQ